MGRYGSHEHGTRSVAQPEMLLRTFSQKNVLLLLLPLLVYVGNVHPGQGHTALDSILHNQHVITRRRS